MQSKPACKEFETRMWQYMDNCLTSEEMLFWKEHLSECPVCSSLLSETKEALSVYESIPMEDVEEETFDRMINNAVKKKKASHLFSRLLDPLYELHSDGFIKKFAFGGMALAMVLAVLFLMHKPGGLNLPDVVKKEFPVQKESSPLISQNVIPEKEPLKTARKTTVARARYEWKDTSSLHTIRHVASSIASIRIKKKENTPALDDWTVQAIAIKRKMDWLKTDIDKSTM